MSLEGGELRLRAVEVRDPSAGSTWLSAGSTWLKELYEEFGPVRDEIALRGLSEEEVNHEIDAAVTEVRGRRA